MTPERPPDPVRVAVAFARLLERLDVSYLVAGSLASSVHGEPRATNDIDIVADLTPEHVRPLLAALGAEHYVGPDAVRDAVERGGSFNVIELATAVKVDVFVAGDDPFDAERLSTRQRAMIWTEPPLEVFLDTAEHTVLRKLEWYRRGGEVSERQWRDVLGVLRVQGGRLDGAQLEAWAERLRVHDLLARALQEARAAT